MQIKQTAVIGAGTMGAGIAEVVARAGYLVTLIDVKDEYVQRGLSMIRNNLDRALTKGKISQADRDSILERINTASDLSGAAHADVVIEAVFENMEVKKNLYQELDKICPAATIFASNTSALSISEMANATERAERFIGMHFFNPVPVMGLVELVKGAKTSPEVFGTSKEFVLSLGKTPVEVNEAPGFVVNRLLIPMINEAAYILMEGVASAEDIDASMKLGANHPLGPLALGDLIGLDVCLAIMETLHRELGEDKYRPCPLIRKLVRAGYLGRKCGRGFFTY